jgi:hypothetical protein
MKFLLNSLQTQNNIYKLLFVINDPIKGEFQFCPSQNAKGLYFSLIDPTNHI